MLTILNFGVDDGAELAQAFQLTRRGQVTGFLEVTETQIPIAARFWPSAQIFTSLAQLKDVAPTFDCLTTHIASLPAGSDPDRYTIWTEIVKAFLPKWVLSQHRAELVFAPGGLEVQLSSLRTMGYTADWYGVPRNPRDIALQPFDPVWIVAEKPSGAVPSPVLDLVRYRLYTLTSGRVNPVTMGGSDVYGRAERFGVPLPSIATLISDAVYFCTQQIGA